MTVSQIESIDIQAAQLHDEYAAAYENAEQLAQRETAVRLELEDLRPRLIESGFFRGMLLSRRMNQLYSEETELLQGRLESGSRVRDSLHASQSHWRSNQETYSEAALLVASRDGYTIKTEDPDALKKAQWKNENISAGQDPFDHFKPFSLENLTPQELEANLQSYPEMNWDIPESSVARARELIMQVPLTHTTQETSLLHPANGSGTYPTIMSHAYLKHINMLKKVDGNEGISSFTFRTDEAMELDSYAFLCLGHPYPTPHADGRGSGVLIINPELLLDDNCIVTPDDFANINKVSDELGPEQQEDMEPPRSYRASVVSGRGWVEVLARRVAKHMMESPETPYPVTNALSLGEIKYKGQVPGSAITDVLCTEEALLDYMASISNNVITFTQIADRIGINFDNNL